jgi:serine/threonine protein kinase
MATGRPLFKGSNEKDQLDKIFRIRGTPDPEKWVGLKELPLFSEDIPQYDPAELSEFVPTLDEAGLDLLEGMLQLDPS